MLIETGSRIDNVQLELNTIEIFFWFRQFVISNIKKKLDEMFKQNLNIKKLENKEYFRNLKCLIFKIFTKFSFFQPSMFENKPWVCYWLLHSLDLFSIYFKKDYFGKNQNKVLLFLSKINLSKVFKNSNPSLFYLYSSILCSILIKNFNFQILDITSKKSTYYFLKSLTKNVVLPRNSSISDCDGRNLFCIFTISSLYGILSLDLENLCVESFRHLSITSEGFTTKKFSGVHGALNYCWLGSLFFLNTDKKLKLFFGIKKWLLNRQHIFTFGLSGRLSKVPDSCYNFWIGASLILLNIKIGKELGNSYIFYNDKTSSSFSDRSGKITDSYHICYSISGLSLLNFLSMSLDLNITKNFDAKNKYNKLNYLGKLNPVFNLRETKILNFFSLD